MGHKTLVGGTAYDISGGKVLVGGTAYGIKKGRTLVGGAGYDVSFVTPLSDIPVGGSVFLNVDGVPKEFLVVHQGNPDSSLYDDSCDGVWLLMKDVYDTRMWDRSNNDYENSDAHTYLNGTILGSLDSDIQAQVKQVKIPYHDGTGAGGSVASGSSGLSTKLFLLSGYELGWTTSDSKYFPVDGAKLDYFTAGTDTAANNLRICYIRSGVVEDRTIAWWLRSPVTSGTDRTWIVQPTGDSYSKYAAPNSFGFRPALILPHDAVIDDNYNVVA